MLPSCKWIQDAASGITDAIRSLNMVTTGPLGLLPTSDQTEVALPKKPPLVSSVIQSPRLETVVAGHNILQVDSAGSLLLLSRDPITIGISPSATAFDISLLTPEQATHRSDFRQI